jgi:hypothetical protein
VGEPVKRLTASVPLTFVQYQSYPYYTVDAIPASLIVTTGSTVSAAVRITSLNGFSAVTRCGSAWWGSLNLVSSVSPSSTPGLSPSVSPSCLTLDSGGTAFATLAVAAAALTRPGSYTVTVSASFQVSPSGWVTAAATTVFVTVVQDVYLVPAMLTVTVLSAALIGGVAATLLVRKRLGSGRIRVNAEARSLRQGPFLVDIIALTKSFGETPRP